MSKGPAQRRAPIPSTATSHNGNGSSITGGFVYRGRSSPRDQGTILRRLLRTLDQRLASTPAATSTASSTSSRQMEQTTARRRHRLPDRRARRGAVLRSTWATPTHRHVWRQQAPPHPLVGVKPAPVALASANTTSGPAPLTVTFSSAGSNDPEGRPITYSWDFGDGSLSTAANPSHTYTHQASTWSALRFRTARTVASLRR